MKDQKNIPELSCRDTAGKTNLKVLMTGIVQKLLGIALDNCRISGMSDRSFNQIQRTLKDSYYQVLDFAVQELVKEGYVDAKDILISDRPKDTEK